MKNLFHVTLGFALTFAEDAKEIPKFIQGTLNLFTDASEWLLILTPVAATLFLGVHAYLRGMLTEQSEIAAKNKLMKNVLISALFIFSASGIIKLLSMYYG